MILIFGSSYQGDDYQTALLLSSLEQVGKDCVLINPLSLDSVSKVSLIENHHGVELKVGTLRFVPSSIYMMRWWRIDSLVNLPSNCSYPALFRFKLHHFLVEIRSAFEGAIWLPGSFENLERGESKIVLLHSARESGLATPDVTINSFENPDRPEVSYRKSLGFPFSITNVVGEDGETAVTLFNSDEKRHYGGLPSEGLPWQWQSPVKLKAQIRCVVVGDRVRAYIADSRQFNGKGFREAQEDGLDIKWNKHFLPLDEQTALFSLMRKIGIKMACPEFLVDSSGKYIFIDLNPCGDWAGFIDEKEDRSIALDIAQKL